jgi:hypothetical protein
MRVFIYKRTHQGDPNTLGHFGVQDCMGRLRSCNFDAVIGIGGICAWAESEGISLKVNWIGIGPKRIPQAGQRGPLVLFDHFSIFEEKGQELIRIAPLLARRLLRPKAPRFLFSTGLSASEQLEVDRILTAAKDAQPSLPIRNGVNRNARPHVCTSTGCSPSRSRKRACLP